MVCSCSHPLISHPTDERKVSLLLTCISVVNKHTYIDETIHMHQLQPEVFGDEFHTYSKMVDSFEMKICDIHNLPYPLVPFPSNQPKPPLQVPFMSIPPTPPSSTKRKTSP